jgi:hypothetical protein
MDNFDFGLSQFGHPDVSNLVNDRVDKSTIDKLVNMLTTTGQWVEVKVKRGGQGLSHNWQPVT